MNKCIVNVNSYEAFCSYQYVSRETYEKLEIFKQTLIKWQKAVNLVSNSSLESIWNRHFLDSAQLYKYTKDIKGNILDMGSGAGLPGIVLAMMGNKNINIVESDSKKCTFMREVIRLTETKLIIYNCRIEELDFINPELITSRALAPLKKLVEYADNHMKKNIMVEEKAIKLLFLKGKLYKEELKDLKRVRQIEYEIFPSVTSEYGKIVYITNISKL